MREGGSLEEDTQMVSLSANCFFPWSVVLRSSVNYTALPSVFPSMSALEKAEMGLKLAEQTETGRQEAH